jgi:hypothetical protein
LISLPPRWLAIKSESTLAVQTALHLHNPESCSCLEGLSRYESIFISPSIEGWIIITGDILPDPADDEDIAYRFILNLSRELGEVQYFSANPILHYHSWVRVRSGRVIRAYAWAGRTVWNQGQKPRRKRNWECGHLNMATKAKTFFFKTDRYLS